MVDMIIGGEVVTCPPPYFPKYFWENRKEGSRENEKKLNKMWKDVFFLRILRFFSQLKRLQTKFQSDSLFVDCHVQF